MGLWVPFASKDGGVLRGSAFRGTVSVVSVKPCGVILHRTGDFMCGPLNYAQPLRPWKDQDAVFLEDEDERRKKKRKDKCAELCSSFFKKKSHAFYLLLSFPSVNWVSVTKRVRNSIRKFHSHYKHLQFKIN